MRRFVTAAAVFLLPMLAFADAPPEDLNRFKEEPVSGGLLLIAAYFVMWLVLAGYVARTALKQARLEAELRALEDRLDGKS